MSVMYNGIAFTSPLTTRHSMGPVKDPSGSDQTYTEISLAISAVLNVKYLPATVDQTSPAAVLTSIRHLLTKPRAAFYYDLDSPPGQQGANPIINIPDGGDEWLGPWPDERGFSVNYTTADTLLITWACTTRITDCGGSALVANPLSLRWEDSISFDSEWKATYSRNGTLILSSRDPNTLDWYRRNKLAPAVLGGFRRTNAKYTISKDGLRCDFSFTDEQIRFAPPYPAVDLSIIQSEAAPIGTIRKGTVAVSLTGIQSADVNDLARWALIILYTRVQAAGPLIATVGGKTSLLGVIQLETSETCAGVRVQASCSYKTNPDPSSTNNIAAASGSQWGGPAGAIAGAIGGPVAGAAVGAIGGAAFGGSILGGLVGGPVGVIAGGLAGGIAGGSLFTGKSSAGAVVAPAPEGFGGTTDGNTGSGLTGGTTWADVDAAIASAEAAAAAGNTSPPFEFTDPTSSGEGGGVPFTTGGSAGAIQNETTQQGKQAGIPLFPWVGAGTSLGGIGGFAPWANPSGAVGGPADGVGLASQVTLFAALLKDPCGVAITNSELTANTQSDNELRTTVSLFNDPVAGGQGGTVATTIANVVASLSNLTAAQFPQTVAIPTTTLGLWQNDSDPGVYDLWQCSNEYADDPGIMVVPTCNPAGVNSPINYSSPMMTLYRRWVAKRTGAPPALPPKVVNKPSGDVDANWVYVGGNPAPALRELGLASDGVNVIYEASGVYTFQALDARGVSPAAEIPPFFDSVIGAKITQWITGISVLSSNNSDGSGPVVPGG